MKCCSYLMWEMVSSATQLLVSFVLVALNDKAEDGDVPPLLIRKLVIRYPKYIIDPLYHICCFSKHKNMKKEPKNLKENPQTSTKTDTCPGEKEVAENKKEQVNVNPTSEDRTEVNVIQEEAIVTQEEAIITQEETIVSREEAIVMDSCPKNDVLQLGDEPKEEEKELLCDHDKPFVPRGEGWDDVADALNWFMGAIFVALNVLMFLKYMQPLLTVRLSHLFAENYFIDVTTA